MQQLCDDLLTLLSRLKGAIAEAADQHELTPMQLYALYRIMLGETTRGRLATALHCDASNVTGIVDRLTAQGLVSSQPAPEDRRAKVLKVEPAGHEIIDAFMNELPQRLGCPLLSAMERAKFHRYISKLSA